jgi:hypothetical protein
MLRRAHLAGPALELLRLRVLFFIAITWLPLFLLSLISGHLLGGGGLPFLRDMETHLRFLIALPALVITELIVHHRIRSGLKHFSERGIVTTADAPGFYAILKKAMKVRNSRILEVALLAAAFTLGHMVWEKGVALETANWYEVREGTNVQLTLPGYWLGFVSIPIAQFILFRWYLRLLIWFWLLWRVSRLNLRLVPTHPDRAGGIGFLGEVVHAFSPVLFAQGAVLAGVIANRILYQGQNLVSFRATIFGLISLFVLVVLGPLTVFTPLLFRARLRGLSDYGTLAMSYVRDFDAKWVRGGAKARDEGILGTSDIQSLADLANSYAIVRDMRVVPFTLTDAILLVVATALPLLPLLLTMMPLDELLRRFLKVVF